MAEAARRATHHPETADRRTVAARLQDIEGNPLDSEDIAIFEREGWPHDRRRAYIMADAINSILIDRS
jgi:hypothetical protein